MAPLLLLRLVDATTVQRCTDPSDVKAQRTLRPITDADRTKLGRVIADPLIGDSEHASYGVCVEQPGWLAEPIADELRDSPGDLICCRLGHLTWRHA